LIVIGAAFAKVTFEAQGVVEGVGVGEDAGVAEGEGVGATVGEGVGVVAGVGVAVLAGVGVAVVAGVGVGVEAPSGAGAGIPTVIGVPVLKKPIVAFAACGGRLESKRKLYNVPQRMAFAFWFWAKVSEFQLREPAVCTGVHGVLL
jgi:hypothetical protein